ncbi:hypothetical protein [Flavobacterium saccharophilum]|nr:hypothetical protein [Flavobacterium saccharophilum]
MKQIRIFTIIFFGMQIFFSCSSTKELREERKVWNYKNWDKEFKERAFCLCQLKSYENKGLENALWENDKSYYNPLGMAIFDEVLEPKIKKEMEIIRLDSINSIGKYPDDLKPILQKRAVINHCLEFYNSKRLDSLAKTQQKYWNKIPNIMDKIHLKIPTY